MPNLDERKMIEQIKQAAAAAKEEILSKSVLDALLHASPEDLVGPDPETDLIKGNANPPGAWIHGPAMAEFFAAANRRLNRVASWSGMAVNQVAKVQARLLKGTKLLIIKPAPAEDLTALPVHRYGREVLVNLVTLLGDHGLTVESGYRERFDVAYVPRESPLWPALLIDLGNMRERRFEGKKAGGPSAGTGGESPSQG